MFRLFTASVRSRPPGPPAAPGVLTQLPSCIYVFHHLLAGDQKAAGDNPERGRDGKGDQEIVLGGGKVKPVEDTVDEETNKSILLT